MIWKFESHNLIVYNASAAQLSSCVSGYRSSEEPEPEQRRRNISRITQRVGIDFEPGGTKAEATMRQAKSVKRERNL